MTDRTPLLNSAPPGYPPAQPGYPPAQPGYPPAQPGYPPGQPGYPPAQPGYPPAQPGYPPGQPGYPPAQPGYPPNQGGGPSAPPPELDTKTPVEQLAAEGNDAAPQLPAYEGYSGVGLGGLAMPPPPSYAEVAAPVRDAMPKPAVITEEEAKQALLEHVSTQCCYGKGAARNLKIESITSSNAYHYQFETFNEVRTVAGAFNPYMGEPVDGPERGPPPNAWSIVANAQAAFTNAVQEFEVPHTARVQICHTCSGLSVVRCGHCHGMGRERCHSCSGTGTVHVTHRDQHGHHHHHHERCHHCVGGFKSCHRCFGSGRIQCPTCKGRAMLKFFLKLTVKWETHLDHRYVERTDLPDHLIKDAGGNVLLSEEAPRVAPIMAFPDQEINQLSQSLLQEHFQKYTAGGVIHRQRQVIRQVPVSEVRYTFKNSGYRFFVYGLDHKVYEDDYPQTCCCCRCSVS